MQKMNEKEAIAIIKSILCEYRKKKFGENALHIAIKALEALSLYREGSLVLIPADVFQRQCDELDAYKAIGTVDQCREAVEGMKGEEHE